MTKFEVGEQFPLHNHARGSEQTRVDVNESFFDVCFYSLQAHIDAPFFRKAPIEYGIFSKNDIPYFLVNFIGHMNMDASINIHKVQEDKVESWLNSSGNVVNLYLIDANTNILQAMRMISISVSAAELIRDICEKQDANYPDSQAVDLTIQKIMQHYSTDMMFRNAKIKVKL